MSDEVRFEFRVPERIEGGAYSNVVSVWQTPYEFTLDFGVLPPMAEEREDARVVPCPIVARVRIPTTVVFELLRAVNENMTKYEARFGEIKAPEPKQPDGDAEGGS